MEELKPLREKIDELDDQIISLLGERFQVVRQVADIKGKHGWPVQVPARMEEVKNRCAEKASAKGVDPDLVRNIYTLIIDQAHVEEGDLID